MLMRLLRRVFWIIGAVSAALLFFAGGVFLRLLMGPISLGPVAGAIEDSINRAVTGFVIRFNSAVLEWSRMDGKIYLTVLGTKVFDLNGRIIAQAPKANLDFDEADLLAGNLSLKRFALVGVQLTGVRTSDGIIRLGFGLAQDNTRHPQDHPRNAAERRQYRQLARRLLDPQRAACIPGRTDRALRRLARTPISRSKAARKASTPRSNSAIEISGVASRISARAILRDDGMPRRGTVEIQGLSLPALSKNNPALSYLQPYAITSNVKAGFEFDESGALRTTTFHLDGSGAIATAAFEGAVAPGQVRCRRQL